MPSGFANPMMKPGL